MNSRSRSIYTARVREAHRVFETRTTICENALPESSARTLENGIVVAVELRGALVMPTQ